MAIARHRGGCLGVGHMGERPPKVPPRLAFVTGGGRAGSFTSVADLGGVPRLAGVRNERHAGAACTVCAPGKLARAHFGAPARPSFHATRMSGDRVRTVVLHATLEAAVGGPLALVRSGDRIRLSVRKKSLDLLLDDRKIERRKAETKAAKPDPETLRGYSRLYAEEIQQADEGCDFRFMQPRPLRRP